MKIFTDELNQVRYRDEKGPCGDKGESVGLREIYRDLDFLKLGYTSMLWIYGKMN